MEQSSILSAKFDCPVACQSVQFWLLHMIVKLAYGKIAGAPTVTYTKKLCVSLFEPKGLKLQQ